MNIEGHNLTSKEVFSVDTFIIRYDRNDKLFHLTSLGTVFSCTFMSQTLVDCQYLHYRDCGFSLEISCRDPRATTECVGASWKVSSTSCWLLCCTSDYKDSSRTADGISSSRSTQSHALLEVHVLEEDAYTT
jgi:hypothetical protein